MYICFCEETQHWFSLIKPSLAFRPSFHDNLFVLSFLLSKMALVKIPMAFFVQKAKAISHCLSTCVDGTFTRNNTLCVLAC